MEMFLAQTDSGYYQKLVEFLGTGIGAGSSILYYLILTISLFVIAKKTDTPNGWMAFLPIFNVVLALQIARKPVWWLILFLIPCVNIVVAILTMMGIAERRGKSQALGCLYWVPCFGAFVALYLAFSD